MGYCAVFSLHTDPPALRSGSCLTLGRIEPADWLNQTVFWNVVARWVPQAEVLRLRAMTMAV